MDRNCTPHWLLGSGSRNQSCKGQRISRFAEEGPLQRNLLSSRKRACMETNAVWPFDDPTETAQQCELLISSPFCPTRSHWLCYTIIVIIRLVARASGNKLSCYSQNEPGKILISVGRKTFQTAVRNAFEVERKDELERASIFTVSYQNKENKRKHCFLESIISL